MRVLVVDDEPLVCESIRMSLASAGHQLATAHSGEEALAQFQVRRFDVILIDFNMPGMKGDRLAREIKARDPSQPLILLTGSPPIATSPDFVAVILKPFDLAELREIVAAAA